MLAKTKGDGDKRLVARVRPDMHRRIAEAAELQGATVSQFLLDAVLSRANQVIEQATYLEVSEATFRDMMAALDTPARPLPRLSKAARDYRKRVHDAAKNPS